MTPPVPSFNIKTAFDVFYSINVSIPIIYVCGVGEGRWVGVFVSVEGVCVVVVVVVVVVVILLFLLL